MQRSRAWTTNDELDYINRLPPHLLNGYCLGCQKRSDWGNLDQQRIIHAGFARLRAEAEAA